MTNMALHDTMFGDNTMAECARLFIAYYVCQRIMFEVCFFII